MKVTEATYRRKHLIWVHGDPHSNRQAGMMLEQCLRAHISIHKASRKHNWEWCGLLKPWSPPHGIAPLTKPSLGILPKQVYQLGTKYWNMWVYKGHSNLNQRVQRHHRKHSPTAHMHDLHFDEPLPRCDLDLLLGWRVTIPHMLMFGHLFSS